MSSWPDAKIVCFARDGKPTIHPGGVEQEITGTALRHDMTSHERPPRDDSKRV